MQKTHLFVKAHEDSLSINLKLKLENLSFRVLFRCKDIHVIKYDENKVRWIYSNCFVFGMQKTEKKNPFCYFGKIQSTFWTVNQSAIK